MSWWTKNRKKVIGLGALAAAPFALPAMAGLLGVGGAAGAAGAAGAGAGAAGGIGAALGEAALAAAPGLSLGGQQAAMLAAQNAGLGIGADVLTMQAAASAASPATQAAYSGLGSVTGLLGKAAGSPMARMGLQMMAGGEDQQPMPQAPMQRPPQMQYSNVYQGQRPQSDDEMKRRMLLTSGFLR